MEHDLFAIKLGNKIVIGYESNGQKVIIKDKEQNSLFNYIIKLNDNLEINLAEIIKDIIEEKFGQKGKDFILTYIDEIYRIEITKSGKIYLLEELLVKLFEKIKKIVYNLIKKQLNKTIIIYNNIPYELILILHKAAIMSKLQVINFIDLNKSIRFYLNYYDKFINNNSIALIKIDERIEISVFEKNNIKRIFNSILSKSDINFDNLSLKEELNEINDQKDYEFIKKSINELIVKANGNEEIIDKIYLYNNTESAYLNEICIFGALYSNTFPISKECKVILNFIDYEINYPIKQLIVKKKIYEINQKILEINIDDCKVPFENCYYRNIKIRFIEDIIKQKKSMITIYYNQKNYFFCTKDINIANSAEFIFFKTFPKISLNDKYNIDIEEKFEKNQIFKRVNILNVNREQIKLNGNPLMFYDALDSLNHTPYIITEEMLYPDILFLIGQNLNVLSFFRKDKDYKSSFVQDTNKINFLDLLSYIELIENDDSLENLKKNKNIFLDMIRGCKNPFNKKKIEKYQYGNIQSLNEYDVNILIKYGKYLLFQKIFYNNDNLELNESNYNKYKKIMLSLTSFIDKCKIIEKDSLQIAKIYNAICNILLDYIEKSDEKSEKLIFDLIDFDKESIYKDVNDNNLDLILNLTKKSFLYPYFLQFNSSFNISHTLFEEDNKFISTYKASMLTLNQIKLDLIKSLPKYGIRIFSDANYFATTIVNTDITIYNEKKLFGHFLTSKELDSINDIKYTKRVRISFIQKYERFGHYKKYINKIEKDFVNSPRGIINYDGNSVYILASKQDKEKGKIGESLDYIITNGNSELIDKIFKLDENIDLKGLYDINIFLESNNNDLINILKEIYNSKINYGNFEDNADSENNDENYSSNNKKKQIYFDNEINIKKESEDDKNSDDEFERRKVEMISANSIQKYTFEKNTIQEFKRINGKLVPINNNTNK